MKVRILENYNNWLVQKGRIYEVDPKLTGLEEICKSALTRKDLNPRDREFWKERLAWVKNQQKAEDGSLIEEEVGRVGED